MRVMRSDLDGSQSETLVQTGEGEDDRSRATRWCVGIAVDLQAGTFIYWTQKGADNAVWGHPARLDRESRRAKRG